MSRPTWRIVPAILAVATLGAQAPAQLAKEGDKAYQEKRFAQAGALYSRAFEADASNPAAAYNAACAWALAGDREAAFRYLARAVEAGFTDADNAVKDADLAALHADARWSGLLARMHARSALEAALWDSPAFRTAYRDQLPEDERIAGLSRFWSEVKFGFADPDRLAALDWDALYLQYLPRVRAAASTAGYYRVLMELCARLQDGHTNVYPPGAVIEATLARPLLRTRLIEGRVLVTGVYDPNLQAGGLLPGTEIVAVDGQPVKAYAQASLAPWQCASTPQDLENRIYTFSFLAGPLTESPLLGCVGPSGKPFSLRVPRVGDAAWRKAAPPPAPFTLRWLPGGVALVALNTFGDDTAANQFLAAFPEIARARALILDVRANGGGNSGVGHRILATLADRPFATNAWSTREYNPAFRAWGRPAPRYLGEPGSVPPDPAHHFAGPVIVLTGPGTYSAAEDFAVAFDAMKRGLILGEPTGGSTGQPLFFRLPGGGSARVCTKRDTYPDGRAFVGVGVQPGRLVRPTVADLRAGRDTVLEAALAQVREAPVGTPR